MQLFCDPVEYRHRVFSKIGYVPHAKQAQVHNSSARIRCFYGAARSGKSYLGRGEAIARLHYPAKQMIWIVGPTYVLADKIFSTVYDYMHDPKFAKYYPIERDSRHNMYIKLKNGTEIVGKSADNPNSLLGEGVDFMIVDEASRIDDEVYTRYLEMRLLTSRGDMLLLSTPCGRGNKFHEYCLHGQDPDPKYSHIESFHATIYDNPAVDLEGVEEIRRTIGETDPIGWKQEMMGEFIDHEGAVFPSYNENLFFGKVPYDEKMTAFACIDPGVRNAFACEFLHHDARRNHVRVFDEFYARGKSTLDYAEIIRPMFIKYNVKKCVVDPREPDAMMILQRIIPECKFMPGNAEEVEFGISIFRDHFSLDKNSQPYIMFSKERCKYIRSEFSKIHYPKGIKEHTKGDDHAISAVRYFLVTFCNFLQRAKMSHYTFGEHKSIISAPALDRAASVLPSNDYENELTKRPWMGDNQ